MKKTVSMLLASSMLLATLSACSSSNDTTSSNNGGTSTVPDNDLVLNLTGENPITFPLEEPITLDFYYHQSDKYIFDETWPVWQYITEMTNISFVNTGNIVSGSTTSELALQSVDKFPSDIYGGGGNNTIYFKDYGPAGAFYALDDYMEYLPNYSAYLEENKHTIAATVSSDGKMYYIPVISTAPLSRVFFIREDWVSNLGLELPTTTEEYEQILYAFRDGDPNGNGDTTDEIPFFCDYWTEMLRLTNLWDARTYGSSDTVIRIVLDEETDGMYHAWMTDEFKNGIENISRWYDEGLIDPEIFTKGTSSRKEYIPGDVGGSTRDMIASTSSYHDTVDIDGFNFIVMTPVVTPAGQQYEENGRTSIGFNGWAISTSCPEEYVPAVFALFDYFWSEEGSILANFGIEGVDYNMVDGEPIFTDKVLKNTENKAVNTYLIENLGAQINIGRIQDFRYEIQWTHDIGKEGIDMYLEEGYHEVFRMPDMDFGVNTEEKNALTSTINDYLDEKIQAFVIGDWTLIDGQWANYITDLNNFGAPRLVEIYDEAYANYLTFFN